MMERWAQAGRCTAHLAAACEQTHGLLAAEWKERDGFCWPQWEGTLALHECPGTTQGGYSGEHSLDSKIFECPFQQNRSVILTSQSSKTGDKVLLEQAPCHTKISTSHDIAPTREDGSQEGNKCSWPPRLQHGARGRQHLWESTWAVLPAGEQGKCRYFSSNNSLGISSADASVWPAARRRLLPKHETRAGGRRLSSMGWVQLFGWNIKLSLYNHHLLA